MRPLLRLIKILFFTKRVSSSDLTDIWLILFFWETWEDNEKYRDESRQFYASHKVKNWQYELWRKIAFYKVR